MKIYATEDLLTPEDFQTSHARSPKKIDPKNAAGK
jgi:hypothetical protein